MSPICAYDRPARRRLITAVAQAVQRQAFQFGDRVACLGKLPAEFLGRERLAILLQQVRTRSPLPCRHFRSERWHDRAPHIALPLLCRECEGIASLISVDIGWPKPHYVAAAQAGVLVEHEAAPHSSESSVRSHEAQR